MAPQLPSSSSSSAMMSDDKNDMDPSNEPRIDLNYLMAQLCDIAKVPTNGYDICAKSFGDYFLEYMREKQGRWNEGERLIQDALTDISTPQPFKYIAYGLRNNAIQPPLPPSCHLNGNSTSAELSQVPQNEINKVVLETPQIADLETMPVLPPDLSILSLPVSCPSPEVISMTSPPQYSVSSFYPSSPTFCVISTTSTIPGEGHTSWNNIGQSLITNETESSSSRQLRPRKSKDQQSTNSSKEKVSIQHVTKPTEKRTKQGKFFCRQDLCTRNFYELSKLKLHLRKKHGLVNPLEDYVIGCSICGIQFKTKDEFYSHKKTKHNIKEVIPRPEIVPSMTPQQFQPDPYSPFRNPMLMTPRDVEIDLELNADEDVIIEYTSDDEECRQIDMQPEEGLEMNQEQEQLTVDTNDLANNSPPQFSHWSNDLEMEEEQNDVDSSLQSQERDTDLVSDDKKEEQIDSLVQAVVNLSRLSQANTHIPLPSNTNSPLSPEIDHQQHSNGIKNGNQRANSSVEPSVGLNTHNGHGESYGCLMCPQAFMTLLQLRIHQSGERHQSNTQDVRVRCGLCKELFDGCKSFHTHRAQVHRHLISNHEQVKETDKTQSSRQQADERISHSQIGEQRQNEVNNTSNEVNDQVSNDDHEKQKESLVSTDLNMSPLTLAGKGSQLPSNASSTPPPQMDQQRYSYDLINGNQNDSVNSSAEIVPQSSRQTGHMNDQGKHKTDIKSILIRRFDCPEKKMTYYLCVTCCSSFFQYGLIGLRRHMSVKHKSARRVTCDKCKLNFGSCTSLHFHWYKCAKSDKGISKTFSLQREEIKEKRDWGMEEGERESALKSFKIPRIKDRSK